MKRFIHLVLFAGLATAAYAHGQPAGNTAPPTPKPASQYGQLEGTVTTPDGFAIWVPMNHGGVHVTGVAEDGRKKFDAPTDTTMGGLYRVDKLPPGYYDLKIHTGYVNGIAYQPQVIYSIQIKPNEKTVLNIKMDQGEGLNVVGAPVYPTPSAARAAEEAKARADNEAQKAEAQSAAITVITASDSRPSN